MNRVHAKRLEDVVLACALASRKPRSLAQLATLTARYRPDGVDAEAWRELVAAAVARLQAAGLLDEARAPGQEAAAARTRLGVGENTDWDKVTGKHLPRLALGIATDDTAAGKRLAAANGWAAAIVARAQGFWPAEASEPPPGAGQVMDQLVWRGLGLSSKPRPSPDEVRAHFVRRLIGESVADGKAERHLRLAAAQAVGAPRGESGPLRDALVERWLAGHPLGAETVDLDEPAPPATPDEPPLVSFAEAVLAAAHDAVEGRFGDRQVFIASVWRRLRSDPTFGALSLDDFKTRLVEAHRAGLLALVRADLVGVMDPVQVAESEAGHHDARYHFVVQEAT